MDAYDYKRLRVRAMGEKGDQKDHSLVMAFDELRRQGIVHLIDYAEFYSNDAQQQYLRQNQVLLESLSEETHQQAARTGIEAWTGYARGTYQESFRAGLGEDVDAFADLRQQEQDLKQDIKRETGDPVQWNEKLLNKAVAALAVREAADDAFDCDVDRVVAGSEHSILCDFLDASQHHTASGSPATDDVASHLDDLNPSTRIAGLTPSLASQTRTALNAIGDIAVDITGVQHDDWIVLGPSFALPQYYDLFENFDQIQREIRRGESDQLAAETEVVLNTLEHGDDHTLLPTKLQYHADWITEQTESFDIDIKRHPLTDMVGYALSLSNYSRELRNLTECEELSQAAIFLGASMASNPVVRYQDTDISWRAREFIDRIAPPSMDGQEIEPFRQERSAQTWDEHTDWYEAPDRMR